MKKRMFSLFDGGALVASALLGAGVGWASEPPRGCFRSVAEAALQTRALDPGTIRPETLGFRLEDRRPDALRATSWAVVRSCDHPERPAVMVQVPDAAGGRMGRLEPASQGISTSHAAALVELAVTAGSLVRVVRVEANLRFDTVGVAQVGGAIGDRIRVRLMRTADSAGEPEQFLTATIRGANLLELEP
jgi:hypothetical protein